jgi:hypothetical protein
MCGRHLSYKERATLMEYLTLQDTPHRHYNPSHSHSMASVAAVRSASPLLSQPTNPPLLPLLSSPFRPPAVEARGSSSFPTNCHPANLPVAEGDAPRSIVSGSQQRDNYEIDRKNSTYLENEIRDKFLTSLQNVHMRSSPPIQPNEHGYADKLPSFSEVGCARIARIRGC